MDFKVQKQILANGLPVIQIPLGTDSITVMCLVGAGSRWETPQTNGLSHFLEHMVFKGTEKYSNALKLSSAIDSVGAEFNAFTGKETTCFFVKAAAEHLELALEVVSQLVFKPLLEAEELEKERGVIIEEINMYEDQPMIKVGQLFDRLIYGNSALGWDVAGKKENIRSLQIKDFQTYRQRFYQPENMVLVLAGGQDKVDGLVKKHFGIKRVKDQKIDSQLNLPQSDSMVKVVYKPIEQAHFCLGVRAIERSHPDRYALAVLATILGGNMSSRLFTEVREKRGLAYYIRTRREGFVAAGHLVSQAGTDVSKVEEAIKIVITEYQKAQKISAKELKKAQQFLKGHLILGLENSKAVAGMISDDLLLEGKVRLPQEIIKQVEKVSINDLQRLAKQFLKPSALKLSVVGPFKDRQPFEKLL